jgi:hypothetical protein
MSEGATRFLVALGMTRLSYRPLVLDQGACRGAANFGNFGNFGNFWGIGARGR